MTDIDPKSDIELHAVDEHVIVRVPLAGPVTGEWIRRYQRLARATGVPAQTQTHPDRAWIVVSVPADGNQREVAATMDAARALIAEADAGERAPAAAQAESIIRDWWARRRESAPHRPISRVAVVRTGIGAEALAAARRAGRGDRRDVAPAIPVQRGPEQLNPVVAPPGWRPQYFDYLYLGFTNATAFSPTDVMPLARWAKAVMTLQAAGSLAVLGLVIARAVNILP